MSFLCNKHSFTCPDVNTYVFWDAFHPTERTNKIISDSVIPTLLAEFH
uniref:GDSL esterase/lipase n=1 Tax=Rhizophora mucronata TaxID=61149 RepID=A0A2P2IMA4_RHIMU